MEERRKDYPHITEVIDDIKIKVDKIYTRLYENGLVAEVKANTIYISTQKRYIGVVLTSFIVGIVGVIIAFFVIKLNIPH